MGQNFAFRRFSQKRKHRVVDRQIGQFFVYPVADASVLTPEPQRVRERFFARYKEGGPTAATEWFYKLCRDCDYRANMEAAPCITHSAPPEPAARKKAAPASAEAEKVVPPADENA